MSFDYSQTYLYKLHKLTNLLDKTFDQNLRRYADIGLSQLTLLLSVDQHQPVSQRTVANFLDISPAAISRQVDIAVQKGWIIVTDTDKDRRAQVLKMTKEGDIVTKKGMQALEEHVFDIFRHSDGSTNLMQHVDILSDNIKALDKSAYVPLKGDDMKVIPKATDLFRSNGGNINKAVMDVQKTVGISITESWWRTNVGPANNDLDTARRFDAAYAKHVVKLRGE